MISCSITYILSVELYNGYTDWSTSPYAFSGAQLVTGSQLQFVVEPETPSVVLVCGISKDGLVTTEIERLDFTSIAETSTLHVKKADFKRRTVVKQYIQDSNVDRL